MPSLHYGWLSREPRILYQILLPNLDIGRWLTGPGVVRICQPWWHTKRDEVLNFIAEASALRPQDTFIILLNEPKVVVELKALGVPAYFIHQNAFIDEAVFRPNAEVTPIYDAVMTARLSRFKRHQLAKLVPKLLLVSAVVCAADELAYGKELRDMMPQAVITGEQTRYHYGPAMVRLLNEAKVGLILSAVEGGNYATTEYLLCGLPVVSTGNLGGRNEWLDPEFCRIVPPDEQCVAAAVKELISRRIPPQEIRERTLAKMTEHRAKFCELGQEIYGAAGAGRDFARDFYAEFKPKLGKWGDASKVMELFDDP